MENIQDYLRPWQLGPMVAVLGAWLFGGGYLLAARYAGAVHRLSFYAPYRSDPDRWAAILADLKSL